MDINYKRKSGIYKLIHQKRGIIYIGSATCIYTRLHNHYSMLKKGIHDNKILQAVYNRHGKANLKWEVVELCPKNHLIEREQFYIDSLRPGMNICKYARNTLGYKHSDAMKRLFSEKRKGNKNSLGRVLSNETKQLISEKAKKRGIPKICVEASKKANKGRKHSQSLRNKIAKIQSKITPQQAIEIKEKRSRGVFQRVIAKEYEVSQRLIARVEKGIGLYGTSEYFECKEQTAQLKLL